MDFATSLSAEQPIFDWALASGDLAGDDGLYTAVTISLFTDRLASPDDLLPSTDGDRRGWWGDAYLPMTADGDADRIGSRLWLLIRAKQIPETAQLARAYCQEALAWLVDDGVAAEIDVPLPSFPRMGMMQIDIAVTQRPAAGAALGRRYQALWDMTSGQVAGIVYGWG